MGTLESIAATLERIDSKLSVIANALDSKSARLDEDTQPDVKLMRIASKAFDDLFEQSDEGELSRPEICKSLELYDDGEAIEQGIRNPKSAAYRALLRVVRSHASRERFVRGVKVYSGVRVKSTNQSVSDRALKFAHDTAKLCLLKVRYVKTDCEALYAEVRDFDYGVGIDVREVYSSMHFELKDGATLSFDTDAIHEFCNADELVRISDTDAIGSLYNAYRGDFVENRTGDIRHWREESKNPDDDIFTEGLEAAGELLYFTLLKTALTVAKEHMDKWNDNNNGATK